MLLFGDLSSLFLAMSEHGPLGDETENEARSSRTTARILVVEDDDDVRETLADILQYEGYAVLTAGNGKEALDHLRHGPRPDLILLDLMMPILNGWALRGKQLQDPLLAGIPVIVLSGVHDVEQQAESLNVTAYLVKPIEVDRLLQAIRRVCA